MDAYMAEYMVEDGEEVRHADKSVDSWRSLVGTAAIYSFSGLFPLGMLYWTYGELHVTAFDALSLMAPFLLAMLVLPLFFVVRVAVTSRRVIIQQGLVGPSIDLDRITSARVVTRTVLDAFRMDASTEYAGFSLRGVRVEIGWVDDTGAPKRTYVKVRQPDALVASIARAAELDGVEEGGVVLDLDADAPTHESVVHARQPTALAGRR